MDYATSAISEETRILFTTQLNQLREDPNRVRADLCACLCVLVWVVSIGRRQESRNLTV